MMASLFRQFLYPGQGPDTGSWQVPPRPYRTVQLHTADGLTLNALYHEAAPGQPTLIFFHGNGDSAQNSSGIVRPMVRAGVGALLVSYRGYAGNPGSPDEDGLYADGMAGIDFLKGEGVDEQAIIVGGFSLGTGIASFVAASGAFKGLILLAPYTSIDDVVGSLFPFMPSGWLVGDHYPTSARLAAISAPVLIIHGSNDPVIPVHHARALAALRPDARVEILSGAGHNDLAFSAQSIMARWVAAL